MTYSYDSELSKVFFFWGGGGHVELFNLVNCSNFEVADKHDVVLEVSDERAVL